MSDTTASQTVCGFTGDDYQQVLADLLPRGFAWPRDLSSVIMRTMRGLAEEYARVTARDCDLLAEAYPCGATETLSDWERVTGLPDPCTGPLPTIQQRRLAICGRLAAFGGASEAYFIHLAASLGFQIQIETFDPFRASQNRAGQPLYNEDWAFAWRVIVQGGTAITWFRAGQSAAGEPLADWGHNLLQCEFENYKPAHTVIIWATRLDTSIWDVNTPQIAIWDSGDSIWDQGAIDNA
jgi:uncharacterized protein YmfQ (DUF2313 family)